LPFGQGVHSGDPVDSAKVPLGHGVQVDAPSFEYVPAAHGVQDEAPAAEYVPAAHGKHFDPDLYVPAGHDETHSLAPSAEAFPDGHAVHDELPGDDAYVPAAHNVQLDDEVEDVYDPAGH
jgi:hypothetical protein